MGRPEAARLRELGHQGAPGKRWPELRGDQSCAMAAARLLLRLAGRLESVSFTQSVCGLLGAGQRPGPWHTHCSLERGQLVLSSNPFPGASERLPIQVGTGNQQGT